MRLATFKRSDGAIAIGAVGKQHDVVVDVQIAHARRRGGVHSALHDMLALMAGGPAALNDARELESWAGTEPDGAVVKRLEDVSLLSSVPVPAQIRDFSSFESHIKGAAAAITREQARKADPVASAPDPESSSAGDRDISAKAARKHIFGFAARPATIRATLASTARMHQRPARHESDPTSLPRAAVPIATVPSEEGPAAA
jgi:hypothetical protein